MDPSVTPTGHGPHCRMPGSQPDRPVTPMGMWYPHGDASGQGGSPLSCSPWACAWGVDESEHLFKKQNRRIPQVKQPPGQLLGVTDLGHGCGALGSGLQRSGLPTSPRLEVLCLTASCTHADGVGPLPGVQLTLAAHGGRSRPAQPQPQLLCFPGTPARTGLGSVPRRAAWRNHSPE